MSRIVLISSFVALLSATGTLSGNAAESANQREWAQYRLACADVGIDPVSAAFNQCVADLQHSLWSLDNMYKS
jgi:hypothetical protein